ncbi:NrfD/PsrC family molybdoenzyme membrane anchor subunit [Actinomadura rugatobispora]|uniref:NrfD/PsrC family molybdoenzyme membrane anchor subunit n=1 Tax=Actinomadura rugatobispora TaxID=1994 RepID=A0ABW0ZWI8_9ACTN|nr:polysulfide reductase NrfD [Actinomadura rugatobispora]
MSEAEVTREGERGRRPGREAVPGERGGYERPGPRRRRKGERTVVPEAEFGSYYGRPIIKEPPWAAVDIAGYLFFGGLAGGSSALAAGAELTGRPALARAGKIGALAAISLSTAALIHDLGRPARFLNMLRVVKPTSPMSMGSWILIAYGPATGVAAVTDVTGLLLRGGTTPHTPRKGKPSRLPPLRWRSATGTGTVPRIGRAATIWAGLSGAGVASYTSVLIANTAVPAWHEAHREMPFMFVGSGTIAASGLGLLAAPVHENAPARASAVFGAVLELAAGHRMRRRLGLLAEPYRKGRGGALMRAAQALTVAGTAGAAFAAGRSRLGAALAGGALLAGSACTRFGVFEAGRASARDPHYTVAAQRSGHAPAVE